MDKTTTHCAKENYILKYDFGAKRHPAMGIQYREQIKYDCMKKITCHKFVKDHYNETKSSSMLKVTFYSKIMDKNIELHVINEHVAYGMK